MRHGQAQLYTASDHQRPLNNAGKLEVSQSAQFIAKTLSSLVVLHFDVLVSDATRTRETWTLIKSYLETQDLLNVVSYSVNYRPDLYLASASKMESIISDIQVQFDNKLKLFPQKDSKETSTHLILLIAHNPGSSDLLYDLVGQVTSLKTSQIAHLIQEIPFELWNLHTS